MKGKFSKRVADGLGRVLKHGYIAVMLAGISVFSFMYEPLLAIAGGFPKTGGETIADFNGSMSNLFLNFDDLSYDVDGNDSLLHEAWVSGNGNTVSGNSAVADTTPPRIQIKNIDGYNDDNCMYGVPGMQVELLVTDFQYTKSGGQIKGSGVENIIYEIYGTEYTVPVVEDSAVIVFDEELAASVKMYCMDGAGNISNIIEQYFIVDGNAPFVEAECILLSETDEVAVKITVSENGEVISGIGEVSCWIDEAEYPMTESAEGQTVSQGDLENWDDFYKFSIPLENDGKLHKIAVQVFDKAGNETFVNYDIQALDNIVVSVPETFGIYINPWYINQERQIWSDDIPIENLSASDIQVDITNIEVVVKDDNEEEIEKECGLRLELLTYKEGKIYPEIKEYTISDNQKDLASFELKQKDSNNSNDIEEKTVLRISGTVAEGTEKLWREGDLTIKIMFAYKRLIEESDLISDVKLQLEE